MPEIPTESDCPHVAGQAGFVSSLQHSVAYLSMIQGALPTGISTVISCNGKVARLLSTAQANNFAELSTMYRFCYMQN